ncbi:MAG: rhomboid family intramembrane serine protease [Bacillota bacterium]
MSLSEYLIGINIFIYIIMNFYHLLIENNFTKVLITFGAKINYLIAEGQYFRFLTPIFIHINLYHIAFNCLALYIIGRDLENIFGKKKFLIIYFFSGIISTVGSFMFNNSISAGASGAIFGLLGCHLFLYLNYKEIYKKLYGNSFLVLIAINIAFGFINSRIDNVGHIGGLLAGLLIASIVDIKKYKLLIKRQLLLGFTVLLLFFISFWSINNYKNSTDYYIYKAVTLTRTNQLTDAKNTVKKGIEKFPNNKSIKDLSNELDKINN